MELKREFITHLKVLMVLTLAFICVINAQRTAGS